MPASHQEIPPELASALLDLINPSQSAAHGWVNRRVETVAFVGRSRVRRQMSIDFTVPKYYGDILRKHERPVVPLSFLNRSPVLADFDLFDEHNSAVSLCTSKFSGELTRGILLAASTDAGLTFSVGDEVDEYLQNLVSREKPPQQQPKSLREYLTPLIAKNNEPARVLDWLVGSLSRSFILMAELEPEELTKRKVLKYRYEVASGARPVGPLKYLFSPSSLGLTPTEVSFQVQEHLLAWATSYHFEVESPEGARVTAMYWRLERGNQRIVLRPNIKDEMLTGSLSHVLWENSRVKLVKEGPRPHLRMLPDPNSSERNLTRDTYPKVKFRDIRSVTNATSSRLRYAPTAALTLAAVVWFGWALAIMSTWLLQAAARVLMIPFVITEPIWRRRSTPRGGRTAPEEGFGVILKVIPEVEILPTAGLLAGFALTVALAVGWRYHHQLFVTTSTRSVVSTAATVVLAAPAIFAGIAARPTHTVATRIHAGCRLLLLLVVAVSFGAAVSLISDRPPSWLWPTFFATACVSTLLSGAAVVSLVHQQKVFDRYTGSLETWEA